MTASSVEVAVASRHLTVRVHGTMDHETAPFLRNRLLDESTESQRNVVLDLSTVSFCDSAALNVPVWAWQRTEKTVPRWFWPVSRRL